MKAKAEEEISANGGVLRDFTEFELLITGGKSHVLSKIYKLLLKYETESEQVKHCMVKWMQNFNEQIQFNVWEYLWSTNLKFSKCQALKEQWYKMFFRWYLTPKKISKMTNKTDNKCWKCANAVGSFFHMWWTCDKIKKNWRKIHIKIQTILNVKYDFNAKYYLLSIPPSGIPSTSKEFFFYATTAARLLIASKWRLSETPTEENWFEKMLYFNNIAYLSRSLVENYDPEIQKAWDNFIFVLDSI